MQHYLQEEARALIAIGQAIEQEEDLEHVFVRVGKNGRVTELRIHGTNRLPREIALLEDLVTILLSGCKNLVTLPPREIGKLKKLRKLELVACRDLMAIPSAIFSSSTSMVDNLTTLGLCDCTSLVALPREIGNLKKLKKLNLVSCPSLTMIPSEVSSLLELTVLEVCDCENLADFSDIVGQLQNLQKLTILSCAFSLTDSIWSLSNLVSLSLINIGTTITDLSPDIGRLTKLKELEIGRFGRLQRLPTEIQYLTSLESLCIENCSELHELTDIRPLPNLEKVDFTNCEALTRLPIALFPNVVYLNISGCPRLVITSQDMEHLGFITSIMTSDNVSIQQLFDVYMSWNISGRHLLETHNVPDGLWATIFGQILPIVEPSGKECQKDDANKRIAANVLFLFLREKASLIQAIDPNKNTTACDELQK